MIPGPLPDIPEELPGATQGRKVGPRIKRNQLPEHLRNKRHSEAMIDRALANVFSDGQAPIEDIVAALAVIPNDGTWGSYETTSGRVWVSSGSSEEGREAFRTWALKHSKGRSEGVDGVDHRWDHLCKSPYTQTGYGALYKQAVAADPLFQKPSTAKPEVVPEHEPKIDRPATPGDPPSLFRGEGKPEGMNGHHALPESFYEKPEEHILVTLNKKHAVIGDMGGKCLVLSWVQSHFDPAVQVASFQSFKSFAERYANQYINITKKKGRGDSAEEVEEPTQVGAYWLKWTKRRTYQGIDLVPGGPEVSAEGYLNLWRGFGCQAKAGDWSLMKRHIREVLANGDDVAAVYIMKFAAWAVQNPDKRAEVALVFRGGKGSGKGTFANALKDIFGAHGLQIFSPKHLVGNFNAHLRSCVLLFADEAFWAGDKAGESALKGLITEPTLFIEQKGVDATAWKNRLHVIMAANADWVVPATQGERRYAAFDVSDCRMGDHAWFKALHEQMANGGREAMLFDLLAVDLTGWHPRQIPHTKALRQQKIHSMPPLWEWWEDVLQKARLPHVEEIPCQAPAVDLLDNARVHNEKLRVVTSTALGRFLKSTGAHRVPRNYGVDWKFPALTAARKQFEKAWGAWEWHENEPKTPDWVKKPTTHHQTHNSSSN